MKEEYQHRGRSTAEAESQEHREIDAIGVILHDLCQPLTVLRCRMELSLLDGSPEGLEHAMKLGLQDCAAMVNLLERLNTALSNLQLSLGN